MVQISRSERRKVAVSKFTFIIYGFISFAGLATIYLSWTIIRYVHEENAPNPFSMEQKQFMPQIEKIHLANTKAGSALNELREKALKAAKTETSKRIAFEEKERAPLNEIKQNYEDLIETKEKAEEEKQLQEELKMKEDAYYQYYEDNNDADSTVITMSYNADFIHYIRFVSSLRDNGYGGTIMIGMEKDQDEEIIQYLKSQNVTIKTLISTECTFESAKPLQKCYHPYPNIRREWSHFPLVRDWLSACLECTGPVLFMSSMKRAYFQTNPFGAGSAIKQRLHIFQHHRSLDAAYTPDAKLFQTCHNIDFPATLLIDPEDPEVGYNGMLTSDISVGSRDDVIDYLGLVYSVIREWMQLKECKDYEFPADIGRPIVNYLFLKDRLPYNTRIVPHRVGEVNIAIYEGPLAYESHLNLLQYRGLSLTEAENTPYEGSTEKSWIDAEYLLTNDHGDFINVFYEKSVIIIDYETYGKPFLSWLDKKMNFTTSNYLPNNVEKKKKKHKREDGENDDFYIKVGDKTRPSKDKEKKIRKKHVAIDTNSIRDSEGEPGNDDTKLNKDITGMYYAAEHVSEENDDIRGSDNDRAKFQ